MMDEGHRRGIHTIRLEKKVSQDWIVRSFIALHSRYIHTRICHSMNRIDRTNWWPLLLPSVIRKKKRIQNEALSFIDVFFFVSMKERFDGARDMWKRDGMVTRRHLKIQLEWNAWSMSTKWRSFYLVSQVSLFFKHFFCWHFPFFSVCSEGGTSK